MKRAMVVLGLAALVAGGANAGTAKRDAFVPSGFAFWDESTGLGWFHTAFRSGRPALARTEDGGRTWRIVARPRSVSGIAVTRGTGTAWLARDSCDFWPRCRPRLLRSDDGGLSWHTVGKAAIGISFPTETIGYGSLYDRKDRWRLVRTRDGGESWTSLRSPCRTSTSIAWFATTRDGWVLCKSIPGAGQELKAIFRTHDGGRTWRVAMSMGWLVGRSTPHSISSAGYANGIAFAGGRGWLWQSRFGSYTSPDGGRRWTPIAFTHVPATLELVEIEDVAPVSGRVAYALVRHGWQRRELRRTDDGGRTWRVVHVWRYG